MYPKFAGVRMPQGGKVHFVGYLDVIPPAGRRYKRQGTGAGSTSSLIADIAQALNAA
jgi:hypothetical protein